MENIKLINGYRLELLSIDQLKSVEKLCEKCFDYYILHEGILPSKEMIREIFTVLPPQKKYEDKFVFGIYNFGNELVGAIDIVKDFPIGGEWMLGLMLIEPSKRGTGLGKIVHEALSIWARDLGARSFRIGVIEENQKGNKFWSALGYTKIKEVYMDFSGNKHRVDVMTLQITD